MRPGSSPASGPGPPRSPYRCSAATRSFARAIADCLDDGINGGPEGATVEAGRALAARHSWDAAAAAHRHFYERLIDAGTLRRPAPDFTADHRPTADHSLTADHFAMDALMSTTRSTRLDGTHVPVAVVGGGQAGLSMSRLLVDAEIEHVVLERDRVGAEWRDRRWDSFSLVTPNWQCQLPRWPYRGDDPDGFMVRDEIVAYLEDYAASFDPPLHEGVAVTRLRRRGDGPFELELDGTGSGRLTADAVVVASGPYRRPRIPRIAERLPATIHQLHSSEYRNAEALPTGGVLVVGSASPGCRSPRTCTSPAARCTWRPGPLLGSPASTAAVTSSPGCTTWATTTCPWSATHWVRAPAGRRTTTSPTERRARPRPPRVRAGRHALSRPPAGPRGPTVHLQRRARRQPRPRRRGPQRHQRRNRPVFDGRGYPTQTRGLTRAPGLYVLGLPGCTPGARAASSVSPATPNTSSTPSGRPWKPR